MSVKIPSSPGDAGPEPLDVRGAERALALGYTPAADRPAIAALFALDARLGDIVRTTREPMVGQMRLTWWHDALTRLDDGPAPAEPVLAMLAADVLPRGVTGADLARMIDGWEALLEGPVGDPAMLAIYAEHRGALLFALAGCLVGAGRVPLAAAGAGWALADLAANLSDPAAIAAARRMASERLQDVTGLRWSRPGRGLGALALLARMDVADDPRPARDGKTR